MADIYPSKIVDTHLHLWDIGAYDYPWLSDVPSINRNFLLSDYRDATDGIAIDKMVFLQCEVTPSQCVDEARWISSLAKEDPRIQGIVAWAPLEKGDGARDTLDELCTDPLMRGIRRIIQFEDNVEFCLQPDFVKGVQLLSEYNLNFDICIKGDEQFVNTIELVKQCPNVRFILDHVGKPFIKEGVMDPWRSHITELAALDNTVCKLSGFVVEADPENWADDDIRPYFDHVVESFGTSRVMFGGDWPVCLLAASYREWIELITELTSSYSDMEKQAVFYDNAVAFYRL